MEKTYIMTIRDLSNEARELNAQNIAIKSFEEEVNKKIQIMAKNHIAAITSYLNRQLDEIAKFTTYFSAGIYENEERIIIKIEKRGEDIIYFVNIKPRSFSAFTDFAINKPNFLCRELSFSRIDEIALIHAETLIKNWNKLKRQLINNIKVRIDEIQKENEEKQARLQKKLSLYENFEL